MTSERKVVVITGGVARHRRATVEWFEAIPGEQLCIRVYGTQVNGLSLEELSTVVEPFGSGIVGPPIDE
jgi:hypothetical protein